MEDVSGASHGEDVCGTDGCSIPTYAIPLRDLARGFARMATGESLGSERSKAANRLLNACMNEPFYMAGSKRFCTDVMSLAPGEIFAKTGAEGVFCGAIPGLGLGIALKCDDGAVRASEAMMAATLAHILPQDHAAQAGLSNRLVKDVKTWNRNSVGTIKADLRRV